jgi:hypothetical protein
VNLKVVGEMVLAWLITIPATAVIAFLVYRLTQLPLPAATITLGGLALIGGGLILYAMTHTITAADIEAEIPLEEELAEHEAGPPHLSGHGPVE